MALWVKRRGLWEVATSFSITTLSGYGNASVGSSELLTEFRTLGSMARKERKEAESDSLKGGKQWFTLCTVS